MIAEVNNIQKHLAYILKTGQIPHALLFCGPRGAGKKQTAYDFASALLKTKGNIENHPDAHLLFPEGKTGMHPISAIRKVACDAALVPFKALLKIFIFHEAEKMLPTSSNALLKTLEEPPARTLILLLSNHADKLLPTILSRCQVIAFPPGKKKNIDQATLAFLLGDFSREKLSTFESEHPDAVFETLVMWYRDRLLLEIGGCEEFLYFPDHIMQLKKTPFVQLEKVEKVVNQIRLAFERSIKLSTCLEMFFLTVDSNPTL